MLHNMLHSQQPTQHAAQHAGTHHMLAHSTRQHHGHARPWYNRSLSAAPAPCCCAGSPSRLWQQALLVLSEEGDMRLVSTAGAGRPSLTYLTQGMRCHQLLAHEAAGVLLGVCAPLDDQPPTYGLCVFDPSSGRGAVGCWRACVHRVLCK